MKIPFAIALIPIGFLFGCASGENSSIENASPTISLLRGEIDRSEYAEAIRQRNLAVQEEEQFEHNKQPTRAYNTVSGKFEYVPEDTVQSWNPETKRWEFTPVSDDRD